MTPVVIAIGGAPLTTWTEMTLSRKKDDLTGSLSVTIFAGAVPSIPMVQAAKAGAEIVVYIAGQLAFTGSVDSRTGTGAKKGKDGTAKESKESKGDVSSSISIGPNEYTIKLSARGKTKRLIDSSHQHETTNMMQPTTKEAVDKLIQPYKVQAEFKGKVIKMDKARFRDGAKVMDELHRIALEHCYFMYETRDGKLKITDGVGSESSGDALILGQNIMTFSAEQSEDEAKSKIKVKGQRTKKDIRGKKSLEKTHKTTENKSVKTPAYLGVQLYADATDEALERRARFEMNKRNSASKKITIEVFHVQTPSGQPWDVGNTHYVEVPPEGIFDMFECTELTYHVNAEKELKTTLTLSPPPSGGSGGSGGGGGFGLSALTSVMNIGSARRSQAGVSLSANTYPDPWTAPMLSELPFMSMAESLIKDAEKEEEEEKPPPIPLVLPPWFGEV